MCGEIILRKRGYARLFYVTSERTKTEKSRSHTHTTLLFHGGLAMHVGNRKKKIACGSWLKHIGRNVSILIEG